MVIVSVSGIRGILNQDMTFSDVIGYVQGFSRVATAQEYLLGRDTRSTGVAISKLAGGALMAEGADVVDYGIISTPALFRESRKTGKPAVMVTASHNDPEWNGLKFVLNGRGINQVELERVLTRGTKRQARMQAGRQREEKHATYNAELVSTAGEGSCEGVRVVLDLNGGAAIRHAPVILSRLGCEVISLGDAAGLFSRKIDPTADSLELLRATVKREGAQVGLAFDCDGDRLVMVDRDGKKRSGDYMLALAIDEILHARDNRSVVVSVDTTQAIDEVAAERGAKVYRSRVGEANVIQLMEEKGASLGGEGSSGGLIDGQFNYCRDSMLAAITIVGAIKRKGGKALQQVKSYSQVRLKLEMQRRKAQAAIRRLRKEHKDAEVIDGLKVRVSSKSWVLVRQSNTEDVVRVSAEASSSKEAEELAQHFLSRVRRLA